MGLVYAFIECNLSKTLGKHDLYHGLIAAALGGSMFALVPTLPKIRTVVPSCEYPLQREDATPRNFEPPRTALRLQPLHVA